MQTIKNSFLCIWIYWSHVYLASTISYCKISFIQMINPRIGRNCFFRLCVFFLFSWLDFRTQRKFNGHARTESWEIQFHSDFRGVNTKINGKMWWAANNWLRIMGRLWFICFCFLIIGSRDAHFKPYSVQLPVSWF